MRFTNLIRSAILQNILNDIPDTDHQARFEAAVHADILKQLPAPVAKVYADKSLRPYLLSGHKGYSGARRDAEGNYVGSVFASIPTPLDYEPSQELLAELAPLDAAKRAHDAQVDRTRIAIEGILKSCSTSKQFLERLPEFAKYLPPETAKSSNLPALANLTADLVKLGWPKDGKTSFAPVV